MVVYCEQGAKKDWIRFKSDKMDSVGQKAEQSRMGREAFSTEVLRRRF